MVWLARRRIHTWTKGIFDVLNLSRNGLFGIPGARSHRARTSSTASTWSPSRSPPARLGAHSTCVFDPNSTDSLLRMSKEIVDPTKSPGIYEGPYKRVGRQGNPLFNAAVVGGQTRYLRSTPSKDVTNFGADICSRSSCAMPKTWASTRLSASTPSGLFGPRNDIINALNLGRRSVRRVHRRRDHSTRPSATTSFPTTCSRQLPAHQRPPEGGAPRRSDLLISLIVAGDPLAGAGDGVNEQDDDYLTEFPFVPPAHQGLFEGHGAPRP
jgi:hypothetical protein